MANEVTIYKPNMPIRHINGEDEKLLIALIGKYHRLLGVKFKKDAQIEYLVVLNQADIITKCYAELTLEEIEKAFLMAYNGELKGIKDKDIKANPAKVLNAFRTFKAEQQAQIQRLQEESQEVKQAKNQEYIHQVCDKVKTIIGRGEKIETKNIAGLELYLYAAYYDVMKDFLSVSEEVQEEIENSICLQWWTKLASKQVREQYRIAPDIFQIIAEAWQEGMIHPRIYELASVEIRAHIMAEMINNEIQQQ
jgi:hypothetical protein